MQEFFIKKPKCIYLLKNGLKKGNKCGCKIFLQDLCKRHFNLELKKHSNDNERIIEKNEFVKQLHYEYKMQTEESLKKFTENFNRKINMCKNSDLLPMEIYDMPWLYEEKHIETKIDDNFVFNENIEQNHGKWMLFYKKSSMNDKWQFIKNLYRENKLSGVDSIKCSTNWENPRASSHDEGIIIFYCSNNTEEQIIMTGKNILELLLYKEKDYIYYKTNFQTQDGTSATGIYKNHKYKLLNPFYESKCLINIKKYKTIYN